MQKLLSLFLLVMFFGLNNAIGQESANNFTIVRTELIWQKVYHTQLTYDQVYYKLIESGLLERMQREENNLLTGDTKPIDPNYLNAGYTLFNVPTYLMNSFVTAYVVVEYKEGRYRVTIKRIMLTSKTTTSTDLTETKEYLDVFALKSKGTEMAPSFSKNGSSILDAAFTKLFDLNPTEGGDW